MSTRVEQFASYANVLRDALNLVDHNDQSSELVAGDCGMAQVLDTIMEVNMVLVHSFQCGPVSATDLADVRRKVESLLSVAVPAHSFAH
jgi:hypothetical protein